MKQDHLIKKALTELNQTNIELTNLAGKTGVYTDYTVTFARIFNREKNKEGVKLSDETCKQITLADPEMQTISREYYDFKLRLQIYTELARNLRKKIDALKGVEVEDIALDEMFT